MAMKLAEKSAVSPEDACSTKKILANDPGLIDRAKCKFGDGKVSFLEQKLFITLVTLNHLK